MKKHTLLIFTPLLLLGCMTRDGNSPLAPEDRKPGRIELVSLKDLSKASVEAAQGAQSAGYAFNLDTARSSYQQYFILQNTGDTSVTDIDLVTDNPNLTFSPSHIAVLPPSAGASLIQVIKLNVVHGHRLDGTGWGGLLPRGDLLVNASLAGKTFGPHGETLPIAVSVKLSLYVKIADIGILVDNAQAELQKGGIVVWGGIGANTFMQQYLVSGDYGPTARLLNTGNTPLRIRLWQQGDAYASDSLTLLPDATFPFALHSAIEIDGLGVTTDETIWPPAANGKIYTIIDTY